MLTIFTFYILLLFALIRKMFTVFEQLAKQKDGPGLIFEEKVTATLQPLLKDEMHQLRVMDLFAEISQISQELFTLSQPYLLPIFQGFHTTDDILRKLNFVEIITKVC